MPLLTRIIIKASLVYLAAAIFLSLLLAAARLTDWRLPPGLGPVYFHLFMVGWAAQLIFGVAHWLLPKFSMQQPRGDERIVWAAFILLNLGLVARLVAEPANSVQPAEAWGWTLAASALVQWLAGLGFAWAMWQRVKEK